MRSVPKQTSNSIRSAKAFGRAASLAKTLRHLFTPIIPNVKDRNMQNRLCTAVNKFLQVASDQSAVLPEDNPLAGFRFVATSDLKSCLKFSLVLSRQADGNLLLEIPAIRPSESIAAPTRTNRVELKLMAVRFSVQDNQSYAGQPVVVEIPYNDSMVPERNVVLETVADEDSLVLVVAAVGYFEGTRRINEAGFEAVEIVGVFGEDR